MSPHLHHELGLVGLVPIERIGVDHQPALPVQPEHVAGDLELVLGPRPGRRLRQVRVRDGEGDGAASSVQHQAAGRRVLLNPALA